MINSISMFIFIMMWKLKNSGVMGGWFGVKVLSLIIFLFILWVKIKLVKFGILRVKLLLWVFLFGRVNSSSGVLCLVCYIFFIVVIFVGWCFKVLRLCKFFIKICIGIVNVVIFMVIFKFILVVWCLVLCSIW